ncbi:tryptophan-rich sensory protein [Bacillus sp. AFS088145]|nr:hypothetical protein COI44_07380 [Bacillus sp. AFS088145]
MLAVTAVLLIILTIPYSMLAAVLLIPYAVWTIFATYLSFNLYYLNK